MNDFHNQSTIIISGIAIIVAIIIVGSAIAYITKKLGQKDLTDQSGWKSFQQPLVGFAFMGLVILGIMFVILLLMGIVKI